MSQIAFRVWIGRVESKPQNIATRRFFTAIEVHDDLQGKKLYTKRDPGRFTRIPPSSLPWHAFGQLHSPSFQERERGGGQRRGASRRRLRPLSFLLVRLIALYDQDYGRCLLNRLFCRWHHATTWLREPAPSLLSARALRSNGDRRCGDAGAERSQAVGASAGRKAPSRSRRGPASGNLPRSRPRRAAPRPAGATPARAPGPSPGTPRTQSPAAAARA